MMTEELGQPFRYESQDPQVFLDEMRATGAEMANMSCVYDNFAAWRLRDIPGVDEVSIISRRSRAESRCG